MVKHVILWKLKDEYSKSQKAEIKAGIKEGLEGLKGKIPGLVDIKVNTECLESSNVDVMLDSLFVSEEALMVYSVHPEHVKVADEKVRPFTATRSCLDYPVDDREYLSGKYPIDKSTLMILMDAIPANVFFKDTECKYMMASHICQMLNTGGDPNFTIFGKTDMDIQPDKVLGKKFYEEDKEAIATGRTFDYLQPMKFGDTTYYYQITKNPIRDADGNILGVVGIIGDRTKEIEMQNKLEAETMLNVMKGKF